MLIILISEIIDTVSTIRAGSSLNPFKWWLHVRCDDPLNRCPCGRNNDLVAYTTNKDDDSGYARINFCPRYFALPNLDDTVKENSRKGLPVEHRANLDNYVQNKGVGYMWVNNSRLTSNSRTDLVSRAAPY